VPRLRSAGTSGEVVGLHGDWRKCPDAAVTRNDGGPSRLYAGSEFAPPAMGGRRPQRDRRGGQSYLEEAPVGALTKRYTGRDETGPTKGAATAAPRTRDIAAGPRLEAQRVRGGHRESWGMEEAIPVEVSGSPPAHGATSWPRAGPTGFVCYFLQKKKPDLRWPNGKTREPRNSGEAEGGVMLKAVETPPGAQTGCLHDVLVLPDEPARPLPRWYRVRLLGPGRSRAESGIAAEFAWR